MRAARSSWPARGAARIVGWGLALAPALSCLAQTTGGARRSALPPAARPAPDLPWLVLVPMFVVVLLIAVGIILAVRRRFVGDRDLANFSLEDLRRLRDQRVISADEFNRARQLLAQRELHDYNRKNDGKKK